MNVKYSVLSTQLWLIDLALILMIPKGNLGFGKVGFIFCDLQVALK